MGKLTDTREMETGTLFRPIFQECYHDRHRNGGWFIRQSGTVVEETGSRVLLIELLVVQEDIGDSTGSDRAQVR